jgi:hypothetical protein
MKRMVIAVLLLLPALPGARGALEVSAQEVTSIEIPGNETALSAGVVFGNTIEHGGNADNSYFDSPGMNMESYSFWNGGNFGTFFHGAFVFPAAGDNIEGMHPYDFQWGMLFGPAFRVRFTDMLTLQTGMGFSINGLFGSYEEDDTDYLRSILNFGVGADAGLKFDLTDAFFIKGGVNVVWSFLGITNTRENEKSSSGWGKTDKNFMDNWTLTANPYISFGINIYSPKQRIEIPAYERRPHFGKPLREEAAL